MKLHIRFAMFAVVLLSACTSAVQVGMGPSPAYTGALVTDTPSSTALGAAMPKASPATSTGTPTGAWIALTPDMGGPGTVIRIDGYLPGGLSPQELISDQYLTHGDVCWGSCQTGLLEEALDVKWSATEQGHFSLEIVAPSASWLASDGYHPLLPGNYPISIKNLDLSSEGCPSTKGCPMDVLASASFHLDRGYQGSGCQGPSCGALRPIPTEGAPGTMIQLTGWAPLLEIIGQPFGYDLNLETKPGASSYQNLIDLGLVKQQMDGNLSATFRVPQYDESGSLLTSGSYTLVLNAMTLTRAKGGPPNLIALSSFKINPAPSWVGRERGVPLWIQPAASMVGTLGTDPSDPNRLAYCESGEIRYSKDGGRSWASIPTDAVQSLIPASGIRMGDQGAQPPQCYSVVMDSTHPDSFYAVFGAVDNQYGPPPIYYVGCFTTDLGRTWQLVPAPSIQTSPSGTAGVFGGFRTDGKVIQALYLGEAARPDQTPPMLVRQTIDGGATWSPAVLTCSNSGPCLSWGPAPGAIYGMGSDLLQDVIASYDNGQSWKPTGEAAELRQGWPFQLVALSQDEALLINGRPPYPMLYSPDGGKAWQALSLPPMPGANPGWPAGYPGLQMFPDGSLLAMNEDTGVWWVLPAKSQDWCSLNISSPDKDSPLLQVLGDRVWWLSLMGMPTNVPLANFTCR